MRILQKSPKILSGFARSLGTLCYNVEVRYEFLYAQHIENASFNIHVCNCCEHHHMTSIQKSVQKIQHQLYHHPFLAIKQPLATLLAHQFASTFVREQQLLRDAGDLSEKGHKKAKAPAVPEEGPPTFETHALRGALGRTPMEGKGPRLHVPLATASLEDNCFQFTASRLATSSTRRARFMSMHDTNSRWK